ncbi:MAG TPA: (2Fe-2S) ferredoxin domain-containing protein [Mycobacteriales bacterium]|nr:(2Fe-2S) ferredoxin domain-containing protein [Mycobacteriales bacterium]
MSRARPDAPRLTVLVCRGCCCGTAAKHPGTDHELQEKELTAAVQSVDGVRVRVVDCLDECDRSNVVVLRGASGRAAERDAWLGGVLGSRATEALAGWLADGAEGPLPAPVAGLRFRHRRPGTGR